MILILFIIIVVLAIGITIVMLTTGKSDITTITLKDIKKGLSTGISSVTSGKGFCPDGKTLINNECKVKLIKSDCSKFEIPDPDTNFTTCKKLDNNQKKKSCKNQGKVLYNDNCLVEINQEYCDNQGSYLKPDTTTNNTSCTEMSSDDVKNICSRTQIFYDGKCKEILTEKNCSSKLFLVPDPDKKNTECKKLRTYEMNDICSKLGKNYFEEACHNKVDNEYCKKLSWQHSKEKLFHKFVDENTNSTKCREPNTQEKYKICSDNGFKYDEENDKCLCPEGSDLRDGKCLSIKTKEICFPKKTATTKVANFTKPDPSDPLSCINMDEKEKKDYCKNYNKISISENGQKCKNKCEMRIYSKEKATCNVDTFTYTDPKTKQQTQYNWDNCGDLEYAKKAKKNLIKSVNNKDCLDSCKIRMWSNQRTTCNVDPFTYTDPTTQKKSEYKWDFCDSTINTKKGLNTGTTPATSPETYNINTEFTYRNNKCMRTFTAEECKVDLTLPNYKNNEFYNSIFYKKPDESKDNTKCRLMTKAEEEIECKKPENNAIWVDNKCIKKLAKPILSKNKAAINYIKINIDISGLGEMLNFTIKYKIAKESTSFGPTWINKNVSLDQILDKKIILTINSLEHNTDYKVILKIINNSYSELVSPISDQLKIKTLCDGSIYTDTSCRTKNGKILGPQKGSQFGKVDSDKKDPDINKWPFIKIPNKDPSTGKICGCKEMNTQEREKWCKEKFYSDIDFSSGRQVIVEDDKCKLGVVPVGPPENASAAGLDVNQTVKNDIYLIPENYRTDYPNRIKLYWSYPEESIRQSLNFDDAIPNKYKIERKEFGKSEWIHIHDYIVNEEIDFVNLKTYTDNRNTKFYNVTLDSLNYKSCKDCSSNIIEVTDGKGNVKGNSLTQDECKSYQETNEYGWGVNNNNPFGCILSGDQVRFSTGSMNCSGSNKCIEKSKFTCDNGKLCLNKDSFDEFFLRQKKKNIPDAVLEGQVFSEAFTTNTNILKNQPTEFIWVDGDYGTASLFKPNILPNFNQENQKLKPNRSYQYRITPINNGGEGQSIIIEGRTIPRRISQSECTTYEDKNLTYYQELGITDFKGFKKIADEEQLSCISRTPALRANDCYKLNFTIDGSLIKGIYDSQGKKCVPMSTYTRPGKPTITNISSTKNSIIFTINPPSQKGSPEMTGYWIQYREKGTTDSRRLLYNSNYKKNGTLIIDTIDEKKKYLTFPSPTWLDGTSIDNNSSIKIIHQSTFLKPAVEYEYLIRTVSENELWKTAPESVNITSDSGYILATSDLEVISISTDYSFPTDVPTLTEVTKNYNQIKLNISSFPSGFEGGSNADITKYKLTRYRYNLSNMQSVPESKIEFTIDFSGTNIILKKIINGVSQTITNNQNSEIFIKDAEDSATISKYKPIIFIDNSVIPLTKYNYSIKCMNNKNIYNPSKNLRELMWSNKLEDINVKTLVKNPIPIINTSTNTITISNKRRNLDNTDPNYALFTVSIDDIVDPNVANYSSFPGIYSQINLIVTFQLKYTISVLRTESILANYDSALSKYIANFMVPINTNFEIVFNCIIKGSLNIPGNIASTFESTGSKTLDSIIYGKDILLVDPVNDSVGNYCGNYNESIEDRYQVPMYYNSANNGFCKSRKISENSGSSTYLDNWCTSRLSGTKWYGNNELEPCQTPFDGRWEELTLSNDFRNTCYTLSGDNSVIGDNRVCLNNTNNQAWKVLKKWTYYPPQFGGSIPSEPTEKNNQDLDKKYIKRGNIAFFLQKCENLKTCRENCFADGGTQINLQGKTGLTLYEFNSQVYCNRPNMEPAEISKHSNCKECGNPAGPDPSSNWLSYHTCINGKSGNEKSIDCRFKADEKLDSSGNKIPLIIENDDSTASIPTKILNGKWYQCKSGSTDDSKGHPVYNIVKDDQGRNFCDPPVIKTTEILTSDSGGSEQREVIQKKYFKIENANCANENSSGTFDLCKIKSTEPPSGWDSNVCGTKEYKDFPIFCEGSDGDTTNLWECTKTTDNSGNQISSSKYYTKYLNTGSTKNRYISALQKCKDKCEGPNNGIQTSIGQASGYDRWSGPNNNDPYYNSPGFESDGIYANKCHEENIIYPFFQEGIVEAGYGCKNCSGAQKSLRDQCLDGKYGAPENIKCKQASQVRKGDIATYTLYNGNLENKPVNATFGNTGVNTTITLQGGDSFQTNKWTTGIYNGNCPQKSCSYEYNLSDITVPTDVQRCRGDKKITGAVCKSKISGGTTSITVSDSSCGTDNPNNTIVEGNLTCQIKNDLYKNTSNDSFDTEVNLVPECNQGKKIYKIIKQCQFTDSSGNTTIENTSTRNINCVTLDSNGNYNSNNLSTETKTGIEKTCNCTCLKDGVSVGNAATGSICNINTNCSTDANGDKTCTGNLCISCNQNMSLQSNGTCECTSPYYWNGSSCVKDCVMSEWAEDESSRSGCQSTWRRYMTQAPDGGKECGKTNEIRKLNTPCTFNSHSNTWGTGMGGHTAGQGEIIKYGTITKGCNNGVQKKMSQCHKELGTYRNYRRYPIPGKTFTESSKVCQLRETNGTLRNYNYHIKEDCPAQNSNMMKSWIFEISKISDYSYWNSHPRIDINFKAGGFNTQRVGFAQNKIRVPDSYQDNG